MGRTCFFICQCYSSKSRKEKHVEKLQTGCAYHPYGFIGCGSDDFIGSGIGKIQGGAYAVRGRA
jgi:hypothetical protein